MGRAAHRGSHSTPPGESLLSPDRSREKPKGESFPFVDRPTSNLSQPDERRHVLLHLSLSLSFSFFLFVPLRILSLSIFSPGEQVAHTLVLVSAILDFLSRVLLPRYVVQRRPSSVPRPLAVPPTTTSLSSFVTNIINARRIY